MYVVFEISPLSFEINIECEAVRAASAIDLTLLTTTSPLSPSLTLCPLLTVCVYTVVPFKCHLQIITFSKCVHRKERVTRIIFNLLYFVNAYTFRRHFNFTYTNSVCVYSVLFDFILSSFFLFK